MKQAVDAFLRPLKDLRISVTDQCNFRCTYCMPKEIFGEDYPFLKKDELLSIKELTKVVKAFSLLGVRKVRITGGEPLLRKNLIELIDYTHRQTKIEDISLTTNGVYLPKMAKELKKAGLKRVNISLDALDHDVFQKMNGRNIRVEKVLTGIHAAINVGLSVKVNMVVQKGVNDNQIIPMAQYFKEQKIPLRFIEFMDVGNSNGWDEKQVVKSDDIAQMIHELMPLETVEASYFGEVAKRYRYIDSGVEVGFISSISEPFCSSCTRARISADGVLYTCLFATSGISVKEWLRANVSEEELVKNLQAVWEKRDDQYSVNRHKNGEERKKIEMSYIGG